jgi:hypothetical protein
VAGAWRISKSPPVMPPRLQAHRDN